VISLVSNYGKGLMRYQGPEQRSRRVPSCRQNPTRHGGFARVKEMIPAKPPETAMKRDPVPWFW
jgi:hypothetical protein